jgi:hypothetical protein
VHIALFFSLTVLSLSVMVMVILMDLHSWFGLDSLVAAIVAMVAFGRG